MLCMEGALHLRDSNTASEFSLWPCLQTAYTTKRSFYLTLSSGQPWGKRRQAQREGEGEGEVPEPSGLTVATRGSAQAQQLGGVRIPPGLSGVAMT